MVLSLPSNAGGTVPSLVQELRSLIPKGIKQKQYCNKFNKDVKNAAAAKLLQSCPTLWGPHRRQPMRLPCP